MIEGLRESRIGEIESKAAHERAGVEFIIDYIEANEQLLRAAFVPDDTNENDVPGLLYKRTKEAFDWIDSDTTRVVGVAYSHISRRQINSSQHPLIKLGWARYMPLFHGFEEKGDDEPFPYALTATTEGVEIVDAFRAVQGKVTLEEKLRINQERRMQGESH